MICGGRAHRFEISAPVFERRDQAAIAGDFNTAHAAQVVDVVAPAGAVYVHNAVGAEGRHDSARPARFADGSMVLQ